MRHLLFPPFESLTVLGSDRLERILHQLSKAITSAISSPQPQHKPIQDVLSDLTRLENYPHYLTEMAYEWCSVICENRQRLVDCRLVSLALEIGFCHFNPQEWWIPVMLTHTEHHRELVDIIFKGGDGEAIADLLCAWASGGDSHEPAYTLLGLCTGHLVDLPNRMDLSLRLWWLIIHSVETIGYEGFKGGGMEKFVELLNHLHVCIEDMDVYSGWTLILLKAIQSSKGT